MKENKFFSWMLILSLTLFGCGSEIHSQSSVKDNPIIETLVEEMRNI